MHAFGLHASELGLEQPIQNHRLEGVNSLENWIVRHQASSLRVDCRRSLKSVGRPQAILGPDSGCDIGHFQVRYQPVEIRIRSKEAIKLIDLLFSASTIRRYQQFRHRDRGCHTHVARLLQPDEDQVSQPGISRIGFYLINEDAGIQRKPTVTP
jgi:hypothetical protein